MQLLDTSDQNHHYNALCTRIGLEPYDLAHISYIPALPWHVLEARWAPRSRIWGPSALGRERATTGRPPGREWGILVACKTTPVYSYLNFCGLNLSIYVIINVCNLFWVVYVAYWKNTSILEHLIPAWGTEAGCDVLLSFANLILQRRCELMKGVLWKRGGTWTRGKLMRFRSASISPITTTGMREAPSSIANLTNPALDAPDSALVLCSVG